MSKNDPTGKQHKDVTKNSSQPNVKGDLKDNERSAPRTGSFEVKTPSGIAGSGLKGINRPSNDSASKSVGSGGGASNQSSRASVAGNAPAWTKNSGSKNFGE